MKTTDNHSVNSNIAYRTNSVRVWESSGYKPTIGDFILETSIINRDTLKTDTASWETLTNRAFDKYPCLPWDGGDEGHERWISNGIQPAVEYVIESPALGMAINSQEQLTNPILRGYVTDSHGVCSPRDVGKLISKAANVKYIVETYLNSKEYLKLDGFLRGKGYALQYDIDEYAIGFLPEHAVAGVGALSTNSSESPKRFHLSTSVAKALAEEAKYYGISTINSLLNTIEHEFVHLYGIKNEETLEKLLVEFYNSVIKNIPDANSTYAYERHDTAKRTRDNYEQRKRISEHRKDIVEQLYGRMKSIERVSIDELIGSLEKDGVSDCDIKQAVRLYEKSISQSREYNNKEDCETNLAYNTKISDETSEDNAESDSKSEDSTDGEGSDNSGGE